MHTLINKVHSDTELPVLPENFVKKKLDMSDKEPTKSRAGSYAGKVHVSSLASGDFCPRQYAIAYNESLSLHESFTGGHKVTWELGRAAEKHVRNSFIKEHGAHRVFGKWVCLCEETSREGFHEKATCPKCKSGLDTYAEPDIVDEDAGIKGHADLTFLYGPNTLFIKEIKSMNKRDWDELEAPLPTHIAQAGIYPSLTRDHPFVKQRGLRVSPVVVFIYVTKDFKWGSPYKEFHVDMTDGSYVKVHENMRTEAKKVKDYVEHGIMPERICQSESGSLAKKCPVMFRCFFSYDDIQQTT